MMLGMALASIPCLACVIGLNGQVRLFQRTVFSLRDLELEGVALGSIPCLAYVNETDGSGIFRLIFFYFLNL